jgi:hypothetical protein
MEDLWDYFQVSLHGCLLAKHWLDSWEIISDMKRAMSSRTHATQLLQYLPGVLKKKTPWSESASELYRPSDRRLLAK